MRDEGGTPRSADVLVRTPVAGRVVPRSWLGRELLDCESTLSIDFDLWAALLRFGFEARGSTGP